VTTKRQRWPIAIARLGWWIASKGGRPWPADISRRHCRSTAKGSAVTIAKRRPSAIRSLSSGVSRLPKPSGGVLRAAAGFGALCYIALASGCASVSERFDQAAARLGFVRSEVLGRGFRHAVYRAGADIAGGGPLHVYLAGDGTPYIKRTLPASDPTPRRPVVLDLMAIDETPRLLLGRPCYHGLAGSPGCAPRFWTHGRYGEPIVASMAAALERLSPDERPIVLIGFSGGGALAVLLARRLPDVIAVVTLAGNLDPDAWAARHRYTPLSDSEKPVRGGPLPASVRQWHYVGIKDSNIPPGLTQRAADRLGGRLIVLPATTHGRGWSRHWPGIAKRLSATVHRR